MSERLAKIDEIRGITLISMILYHFMWDLKNIAGLNNMEWYTGLFGKIWQKSICITFIFIAGFCFCFSRKHFKRGMITFLAGALVTSVTLMLMPDNRVVFGVLTLIGSATFIMILVDKIHMKIEQKLDPWTLNLTMLIGNILFFIMCFKINKGLINLFITNIEVPKYMYSGYFMTYIGFPDPTFFSTDYFSILPWMFLYAAGYYFYRFLTCRTKDGRSNGESVLACLKDAKCKPLGLVGSHTLIIYLLHQPVLYLITILVSMHK